jgi:hypothetical protein
MKNRIRILINLVLRYQESAFKLATVVTITALFGSLIIQAICFGTLN